MATSTPRTKFALLILGVLAVACSAQTPDELFREAESAIANGEINTANIHLRNLLRQDPDHVEGRMRLAEVALALGDAALAEQSARRAIDLGAETTAPYLTLLRALEAQGRYQDVIVQFTVAPEFTDDADRSVALSIVGAARHRLGDLAAAEEDLRNALGLQPESADVATRLASVLLDLGERDEGRKMVTQALARDPQHVPALLLRADLELAANQLDAAEATLRDVLYAERDRQSPAYVTASARLIDIDLRRGEVETAAANAEALLGAYPRNFLARLMKAATEFQLGELQTAEERLNQIIADAPRFWAAYRILGMIDAEQDQLGQAEANLQTAVNNDPNDLVARLALAEVYVRRGDIEQARRVFENSRAAEQTDSLFVAMVGGASLQAGQPSLATAYFDSDVILAEGTQQLADLVRVLVSTGAHDRALKTIDEAVLETEDDRLVGEYLRASVHVAARNLDTATEIADRLIEDRPSVALPYGLRAGIALAAQSYDEARAYLLMGREVEPQNIQVLLMLAALEFNVQDWDAAEGYFRDVVELDPDNPRALYGLTQTAERKNDLQQMRSWAQQLPDSPQRTEILGRIDLAEGNFDAAVDAFARAFDARPSVQTAGQYRLAAARAGRPNPEEKLLAWVRDNPLDVRANRLLGDVAMETGDLDGAIDRYEVVLDVNPSHPVALNNLALIYYQRGEEQALEYAERAYQAAPNLPAIADTLGWMHVQEGDPGRGLPLLEGAVEAAPNIPEIRYHLAVALIETGDTARAEEILTTLLSDAAQFEGRADAESRLRALQQ